MFSSFYNFACTNATAAANDGGVTQVTQVGPVHLLQPFTLPTIFASVVSGVQIFFHSIRECDQLLYL